MFEKLVDYIEYHSLSDLLVELMQINFPIFVAKTETTDESTEPSLTSEREVRQDLTPDQKTMISRLQEKKEFVIRKLLQKLSWANQHNME